MSILALYNHRDELRKATASLEKQIQDLENEAIGRWRKVREDKGDITALIFSNPDYEDIADARVNPDNVHVVVKVLDNAAREWVPISIRGVGKIPLYRTGGMGDFDPGFDVTYTEDHKLKFSLNTGHYGMYLPEYKEKGLREISDWVDMLVKLQKTGVVVKLRYEATDLHFLDDGSLYTGGALRATLNDLTEK